MVAYGPSNQDCYLALQPAQILILAGISSFYKIALQFVVRTKSPLQLENSCPGEGSGSLVRPLRKIIYIKFFKTIAKQILRQRQ
jgi:hypothetical protein